MMLKKVSWFFLDFNLINDSCLKISLILLTQCKFITHISLRHFYISPHFHWQSLFLFPQIQKPVDPFEYLRNMQAGASMEPIVDPHSFSSTRQSVSYPVYLMKVMPGSHKYVPGRTWIYKEYMYTSWYTKISCESSFQTFMLAQSWNILPPWKFLRYLVLALWLAMR